MLIPVHFDKKSRYSFYHIDTARPSMLVYLLPESRQVCESSFSSCQELFRKEVGVDSSIYVLYSAYYAQRV